MPWQPLPDNAELDHEALNSSDPDAALHNAKAGKDAPSPPAHFTEMPADAPLDGHALIPPPVGHVLDPNGQVILHDDSGPRLAGSDTGLIGEKGGVHTETNPRFKGANDTLNQMLKDGEPDSNIERYLKGKGFPEQSVETTLAQVRDLRAWMKKNHVDPNHDHKIDIERIQVQNTLGQNLANSDTGIGIVAAGDAATGFNFDSIRGATGGDAEDVRTRLAASEAAHPRATTVGTLAGAVSAGVGMEEAGAAAGLKGLAPAIAADLGYGALAGAGSTDYDSNGNPATLKDRAIGAGEGAAASVAGGVAGRAVAGTAKAIGSAAKNPYVAAVNEAGIPTTVGQQYSGKLGGFVKRTEDRIAGLPLIGDFITVRRVEGIKKFNTRTFEHALAPIGAKIDGRVGENAVDYAQNKISDAFNDALKGKSVVSDPEFASDLTDAITGVRSLPRVGDEVGEQVRTILEPYMKGKTAISGEAMQQMSRELRDLKAGYKADPLKKLIGKEIDNVENAIFGPFKRQAPEVLPAYNKAKLAQRRLYTVADAINLAKNKEGIFMPSDLGRADRSATIKMEGKVGAARGRGQFHNLQRAAQEVLPSKIPDSGTGGRLIVPAIALGAGTGSDESGLTHGAGTTLAGILALAYTRAGQRLLTKPGRGVGGAVGKVLRSDKTRRLLTTTGGVAGALSVSQ